MNFSSSTKRSHHEEEKEKIMRSRPLDSDEYWSGYSDSKPSSSTGFESSERFFSSSSKSKCHTTTVEVPPPTTAWQLSKWFYVLCLFCVGLCLAYGLSPLLSNLYVFFLMVICQSSEQFFSSSSTTVEVPSPSVLPKTTTAYSRIKRFKPLMLPISIAFVWYVFWVRLLMAYGFSRPLSLLYTQIIVAITAAVLRLVLYLVDTETTDKTDTGRISSSIKRSRINYKLLPGFFVFVGCLFCVRLYIAYFGSSQLLSTLSVLFIYFTIVMAYLVLTETDTGIFRCTKKKKKKKKKTDTGRASSSIKRSQPLDSKNSSCKIPTLVTKDVLFGAHTRGTFQNGENKEEKLLWDFDSKNAREWEDVRISSSDFHAPEYSAPLVRACQSSPIMLNSEKEDTSEGFNGERLSTSALSLDDLTNPRSLLDSYATEELKVWHSMKLEQGMDPQNDGMVSYLLRFVMDKEDLQQHSGDRHDDAGKSFGAIYDLGIHTIDSLSAKSVEVVETPPTWEQPNDSAHLLIPGILTLQGGVEEEKSPNLPGVMLIDRVEQTVTKLHGCLGGLATQSASSSDWPIHHVLLHPLEQSTENEAHGANADLCSLNVSLPEMKNVRMTLKRKCRTTNLTFEIHQELFGRRCEGAANTFCVTRICRKYGINQLFRVKRIHKQHGIRQGPFHQKLATRKGYFIGDGRPFDVSSQSLNEKLDSRLQFVHMSQFARSSRHPLGLQEGEAEDLQQYFSCKHKDAMKRRRGCLVQKSFQVLDILTLRKQSKKNRHLVAQSRLVLRHWIRKKKSQNLPRTQKMNCLGGLTAQSASSLHWHIGLPDGGHTASVSEEKNVRKTFKRKYRNMSASFENSQQQFNSRCEGDLNSLSGYLLNEPKDETLFPVPLRKWVVEIQCNLFCSVRNMEVYKSKGNTTGKWDYWLYKPRGTDKILICDLDLKIIPSKFKARDTLFSTGGHSSITIEDFDFVKKSAVGLPDGGHILSLSEKRIMRKASKRKCRSMSVLSFKDHKRHVDRKREDAAKSHGAKRIYRQLVIRRLSTAKGIHKQHGIHWWPFSAIGLPDGGHILLLAEKKFLRKALKRQCGSMSALSLVDLQLHVDRRWADAASNIGAKCIFRRLVLHRESIAKRICRQHGIYRRWPFQQDWATMKGYSSVDERPVEVISLSTHAELVSKLQLFNISWLGRCSPQPSAFAERGENGRPIALSLSESAAMKNIGQRGGHDQSGSAASDSENERTKNMGQRSGHDHSGSAASDSENERTREQEEPEEIHTSTITKDDLKRLLGKLNREDAANILGVSVSTFKRKCREHRIDRWPHVRKKRGGRPPDQHGEGCTSTAHKTPSHNVQTSTEGELFGQNQEANKFRQDFMGGPITSNTESGLVMGSGHPNQHGKCNTSTTYKTQSHNGQTRMQALLVGQNKEANECQRDFVAHQISLNPENGDFSEEASQVNDQSNMSTHPNHDAHVFQQHQIASIRMRTDSNGGSVPWTDSLASQRDQPVASILPSMPTIHRMMSHLAVGSTETFQPEGQSTHHLNHTTPMSPQPRTASTQTVSENMGGALGWRNPETSQEGSCLDRLVSRSSSLAFPTCSDQATPSPHVEGQSMLPTVYPYHHAFVPQPQVALRDVLTWIKWSCEDWRIIFSSLQELFEHINKNSHRRIMEIKAICSDNKMYIIKFPLTMGVTYLKAEVSKRLKVVVDSFSVTYTDKKGHLIYMDCDEDLMDYIFSSLEMDEIIVCIKEKDLNVCTKCGSSM